MFLIEELTEEATSMSHHDKYKMDSREYLLATSRVTQTLGCDRALTPRSRTSDLGPRALAPRASGLGPRALAPRALAPRVMSTDKSWVYQSVRCDLALISID